MKRFGYIRVSATDQNADRQRIALAPFDIPKGNLYMDKQSGKDFARPAYRRMTKRLRRDDLLIVSSLDRLGRNYAEVREQWRRITMEIGADIRVLDMPLLDTGRSKDLLGSFIADLVLQVLSFAAQLERENIHRRQAEGIAAAKARGVKWGKAPLPLPDDFEDIFGRWRGNELSAAESAALCNMSERSFYKKTMDRRRREKEKAAK
ncbi:MAG: recombinase family protein [Clostridiales Family XIII bacterium]|jgi:DNA invertase Pin-like site-specific DNA recombinase|nr:recombinase family protein [Clostridiales Family XIII bacterium]